MDKIPFEDGKLVEAPYVEIDGVKHEVKPAKYEGKTPLIALNLNKMQDNIEKEINTKSTVDNLVIKGNSKQEVREGKNHFNINGTITNGSSLQIANNGVILTKNDSNRVFGVRFDALPAGTYMLSCNITNNTTKKNASIAIRTDTVNEKFFSIPVGTVGKYTQELVLTSGTTNAAYIFISAEDTDGVSITIQDIQIEKGTVATSFEQYGASPSIEFESPVESCGDDINIFDKDKVQIGKAWNLANNTARAIFVEKVNPNDYYTISFENIDNLEEVYCFEKTNETDTTVTVGPIKINNTHTRKISTTSNYLGIQFNKKDISINDIENVKLKIKRGKVPTPYSPYGQGSITAANSNENLIDFSNPTNLTANTTYTFNNDIVKAVGTGGYKRAEFDILGLIKNNEGKTLSFDCESYDFSNTKQGEVQLNYVMNGTTYYCKLFSGKGERQTFSIPNNVKEISSAILNIYVNNSSTTNTEYSITITKPMLYFGTDKLEYVKHNGNPHIIPTQKPMRAIENIRDSFVKIDGAWYEKHNIARKIFDGIENIQLGVVLNNVTRFSLAISNSDSALPQLCNYLKYNTSYSLDEEHFYIYNNTLYLFIDNSIATTVAQLKTWLSNQYNAGIPLYVDYVLETPELIPCTSEQTKALNGIYEAYADGQTIMYSTDDIEPVIEIVKESKEQVQSETNKAISALIERVSQLEARLASAQAEEGA